MEITNDVLAERLKNIDDNNREAHLALKTQIEAFVVENRLLVESQEKRIKSLEFWKVGFVAKFSAYSGLALFLGAALSQIAIRLIFK
jgi:hypothetical protein